MIKLDEHIIDCEMKIPFILGGCVVGNSLAPKINTGSLDSTAATLGSSRKNRSNTAARTRSERVSSLSRRYLALASTKFPAVESFCSAEQ